MATRQITSFSVLFARLTWLLFGPLALAMLTYAIVTVGGGWLMAADVAYFVVLGAMLAGRWVEYRSGQGETAGGEPMTDDDLRRYLVGATVLGLAVWVAANVVGNHWLGS